MKKRILSICASVLLVSTLALGAVACGGIKALVPDSKKISTTYSVSEVTGLAAYDAADFKNYDFDACGMAVLTKTTDDGTEYVLYDVLNGKAVRSVSDGKTMAVATDGVYCVYTPSDPAVEGSKDVYEFLDKTGTVVYTSNEGPIDFFYNCLEFADGTLLRTDASGEVSVIKRSLQPVYKNGMDGYADGYIINGITDASNDLAGFEIFDTDGEYVRTFYLSELPVTEAMIQTGMWCIGRYLCFQYIKVLPETEQDYDFYTEAGNMIAKMDLVTYRYNVKTGKIDVLEDFDFVVNDNEGSYSSDYTVLSGHPIQNGSLQKEEVIQAFDKDGKIHTDLQKLLPGCDDYECDYSAEVALLSNDSTTVLYNAKNGKELTRFRNDQAEYVYGGWILQEIGDMYVYYDKNGNEALELPNAEGEKTWLDVSEDGTIYYTVTPAATAETPAPATTLYSYNAAEGEKTIGTYAEIDKISVSSGWLLTDADGKQSLYLKSEGIFVFKDLENVVAVQNNGSKGGYRFEKDTVVTSRYDIFRVEIGGTDGESTYRYFMLQTNTTMPAAMIF